MFIELKHFNMFFCLGCCRKWKFADTILFKHANDDKRCLPTSSYCHRVCIFGASYKYLLVHNTWTRCLHRWFGQSSSHRPNAHRCRLLCQWMRRRFSRCLYTYFGIFHMDCAKCRLSDYKDKAYRPKKAGWCGKHGIRSYDYLRIFTAKRQGSFVFVE